MNNIHCVFKSMLMVVECARALKRALEKVALFERFLLMRAQMLTSYMHR